MNDLVRDFKLPKEKADMLQGWNLHQRIPGQQRNQRFDASQGLSGAVIQKNGYSSLIYKVSFIAATLQHNRNENPSIPVAYIALTLMRLKNT